MLRLEDFAGIGSALVSCCLILHLVTDISIVVWDILVGGGEHGVMGEKLDG